MQNDKLSALLDTDFKYLTSRLLTVKELIPLCDNRKVRWDLFKEETNLVKQIRELLNECEEVL